MDIVNQNPLNTNCPNNNGTIEMAFGIDLVFEKIFEDSKDFKSLMELRSVCRSFNRGCLRQIRNLFLKIQIEVDETEIPEEHDTELYNDTELNKWNHILINGIDLRISPNKELDEFLPFIKFLKNDVGVEVKQLKLKGLYKLENKYYADIHWAIINQLIGQNREKLRELIGIEDICPLGCTKCTELAQRCHKYGPVQYNAFLNGLNKKQHFTELLISDRLFYRIANEAIGIEQSKEEIIESMKNLIPSITCDHLVITFTEESNDVKQGLPYECLETILRTWKPKSIGIEIHAPRGSRAIQTNRYADGYFKELKFDSPIGTLNGFQDFKFSHLEIDISESKKHSEVFECQARPAEIDVLYSNARKIFPTDKMNIILSKKNFNLREMQTYNFTFANAIFKERQRDLKVNVQLFATILQPRQNCVIACVTCVDGRMMQVSFDEGQLRQKYQKMIGLSSKYRKTFNNVQFIGKRYMIRDVNANSVINVEIWVEKKSFEDYCHTLEPNSRGGGAFLAAQELMDPVHKESCLICQRLYDSE